MKNALVKMAKEKSDHMIAGYISPALQQHYIAEDHGKKGPKGAWNNVKAHFGGGFRAAGRSIVEGVTGAGVGSGVGAAVGGLVGLASKGRYNPAEAAKTGASIGGFAGYNGGIYHGQYASLRNQAKEHHAKYAALCELMEVGVDFEKAAALVSAISESLQAE